MSKPNRRRALYEIVAEKTEYPAELLSSVPTVFLRGTHEAEIDGCVGIREYTDEKVILTLRKKKIEIRGSFLTLSNFRDTVLSVKGNIDTIRFFEGELCSDESETL